MTHTITELKQVRALADACAGDWEAVRPHLVVQALRDLVSRVQELEEQLANAHQSSGAEAYDIACEEMEAYQCKRAQAGKEVGCTGSLVDGMCWVYDRLEELEVSQARVPLSDELPQGFLSDVLTAAGLVSHGKQCKALGSRIGEAVETIWKISIQHREAISAHGITQEKQG